MGTLRFQARLIGAIGVWSSYELEGFEESDIFNTASPKWMSLYDTYEHIRGPHIVSNTEI